jgi:hypothetical protein
MLTARVRGVTTPQAEWGALGPAIRRAVWKNARHFRAHPDPAVSAVAARYARWYLDARTWHTRAQWLALGLVLTDVFVAVVALGWFSGSPAQDRPSTAEKTVIKIASAIAITLAILAPYAVRKVRIIRLYRLELVSRPVLQSVAAASRTEVRPPMAGRAPAAGQDMSVRYDRRRVLRLCAWAFLFPCFLLVIVIGQWLSGPGITPLFVALCGFLAVLGLRIVVPCGWLLVRWVLPGRPVLELDTAGLHLHSIECDLPWTSLAEIRLVPLRYARHGKQGAVMVVFIPQAPSAVLAAIPVAGRRRKRLERSLRVYDTPLTISDNLIDHSGEQLAAAAAAFAAVPVRREE